MNVEQKRPGCIGDIGRMDLTASKLPKKEGIDRAKQ